MTTSHPAPELPKPNTEFPCTCRGLADLRCKFHRHLDSPLNKWEAEHFGPTPPDSRTKAEIWEDEVGRKKSFGPTPPAPADEWVTEAERIVIWFADNVDRDSTLRATLRDKLYKLAENVLSHQATQLMEKAKELRDVEKNHERYTEFQEGWRAALKTVLSELKKLI